MHERDGYMSTDRAIPPTNSLEAIAEFWDTHSLADYWDQTEPADFEFDPKARRHHLVAVDPDLMARIRDVARQRGLQTESLINLWLEQRVQEAAA
jgi:hypothetical protein